MAKSINYNARTFDDYKEQLKLFTQKYYPTIINDFNDASIGQWLMDLNSAVADDLGYHSDRMFQETQIDQAQERKSLLNIARTNGLKVGGKRPAIVEARWSCFVPIDQTNGLNNPDFTYAPILHAGTQASGAGQIFEITKDVNFSQQFNDDGISDRSIIPIRNTNNKIEGYTVTKTCVMYSVESKIYKQPITSTESKPFMEIILPESNVVSVNSIIVKDGFNKTTPTQIEFMTDSDNRWYEVDNFTVDMLFSDNKVQTQNFTTKLVNEISGLTSISGVTTYGNTFSAISNDGSVIYGFIPAVGTWSSISRKFITEYTDNGFCKIIFGGGVNNSDYPDTMNNATDFTKLLLSRMINNQYLGEIPPTNSTVYVYYSIGGGSQTNIAANSMTSIPYANMSISGVDQSKLSRVRTSLSVTNTTPSMSGRDELTNDEIRYLTKYNNSAQDRCVTVKDYLHRVMLMPQKYGSPFKVNVSEKNNKIQITILGLNYDNTLSKNISEIMINNMIEYLKEYKMINDYVEIWAGKIINLRFEIDVTIENGQNQSEIAKSIALYVGSFMDINNHKIGDEIYISKLKSSIGNMNGVKNLIDIRVYNIFDNGYSNNRTKQNIIQNTINQNSVQIDLTASDGVLYSEDDTMFEIKNPKVDIIINTKYK